MEREMNFLEKAIIKLAHNKQIMTEYSEDEKDKQGISQDTEEISGNAKVKEKGRKEKKVNLELDLLESLNYKVKNMNPVIASLTKKTSNDPHKKVRYPNIYGEFQKPSLTTKKKKQRERKIVGIYKNFEQYLDPSQVKKWKNKDVKYSLQMSSIEQ